MLKSILKMPYFTVLLLPTLLFSGEVSAQTVIVEDNAKVSMAISAKEPTRLSVTGDRIALVRGSKEAYQLSNDNTQGAVFIKPILNSSVKCKTCPIHQNGKKLNSKQNCCNNQKNSKALKSFYLFVSTERGRQYVLNLMPSYFKLADNLVLKPQELINESAKTWETSDHYTKILISLTDSILHQKIPPGYVHTVFKKQKEFTFGKDFNLKLSENYTGSHLSVDVYQITNHSQKIQTLKEEDLYQSRDRAIYLQETSIAPHKTVQLIKVTSHV